MLRIAFTLILCMTLSACLSPSKQFSETAHSYSFYSLQLRGKPFVHRLYINQRIASDKQQKIVHVYIDGDGTPWVKNRWVASDPTSRNPLILQMMNVDNTPAIFLGRPCYHGVKDSYCHPRYWTSHRYADIVVKSMVEAMNNWLRQYPFKNLVLIGFSGGGTLAVLMAPYLPQVSRVITIAANFDTDSWSLHHGYLPLKHSLNPINMPALSPNIKQIHLAGLQDKNIPAEMIKKFSNQQINAMFMPIAEFNHHCCWANIWSELLPKITQNEQ